MNLVRGHSFALVLLALALLLTGSFSFTIAAPSSWVFICGILALVYLLCLECSKPSIEPITLRSAHFPAYQPQLRLESQAPPTDPQRQNGDMDTWIETVHSQRNTILLLKIRL